MYHDKRDGDGRFVKKAIQARETNGNGITDTDGDGTPIATEIRTQVGTTVTTETTTTIVYFDSIEEVGADVDKFFAPLGIAGIGATVEDGNEEDSEC